MADVVVIGAANMDVGAVADGALVAGDSRPGRVMLSPGGVGFNIARNLRLLAVDTAMVTVLGADAFGQELLRQGEALGLDMGPSAVLPGGRTSTYVFLAGDDGEMAAAVSDMAIHAALTPDFLARRLDRINGAELVVVDANLPGESIAWLADHCTVPMVADPVSTAKAERLLPLLPHLLALKPNRMEAGFLTGLPVDTEAQVAAAARKLLDMGPQQVYISLSAHGIYAAQRDGKTVRLPCPPLRMVNATGGGDAMVAALTASILRGDSLAESAKNAICAGALTATAPSTVYPGMGWAAIETIREREEI